MVLWTRCLVQVGLYCADPSFAAQQEEQLQHPQVRRWLLGSARVNSTAFTMGKNASQGHGGSDDWLAQSPACFGRPPPPAALLLGTGAEAELAQSGFVPHPLMWLQHRVLGASPPIQLFDFSKMLTVCTNSPLPTNSREQTPPHPAL